MEMAEEDQETVVGGEGETLERYASGRWKWAEFLKKGSLVEVTSQEEGFVGSWFEATVIKPPQNPRSTFKKKRVTLVEYTTLLSADENTLLREYADIVLIRPRPPPPRTHECKDPLEEMVLVDTYDRDGWWTGVICRVTEDGRYFVAYEDPPHVLEFRRPFLRLHWDWIDGTWVLPPKVKELPDRLKEIIACGIGSDKSLEKPIVLATRALIKCNSDCFKTPGPSSVEQSTPENAVLSPVPISSIQDLSEEEYLNNHSTYSRFPKKFNRKGEAGSPTIQKSQIEDKASSHRRKRLRSLNVGGLSAGIVIPLEITSTCSLFPSWSIGGQDCCAGATGGADEVAWKTSMGREPAANRSGLPVISGAEFTGARETAETEEHLAIVAMDNMVFKEGPSLPFIKGSPIWKSVDSLEVFRKFPQEPHFVPLAGCKEVYREGLAIAKMVTFASTVEKASKLKLGDPKCSFNDCLETLSDLESHGFDVKAIEIHLQELLSVKDGQEKLEKETNEAESQILELTNEKTKASEKADKIIKKIKRLQEELVLALSEKEKKETEIKKLRKSVDAMYEAMQSRRVEFEEWLSKSPLHA